MEATTVESRFKELCFLSEEATDPKLKLLLLIHAINLHNNLKCNGLGENDPEGDYVLPPNWTKDADGVYSLRYHDPKSKDTIYLKFVTDDDSFDINGVTASQNDKITSLELKVSEHKNLDTETINKLHKRYQNDFLLKLLPHLKPEEPKKVETEPTRVINPPVDDRGFFWNQPRNVHPPTNPLGDYGRSDLFPTSTNPLDIHSGGMLLGPRNPLFQGGQPAHGSHPHIRYDPTGPGDIDPTNPDPDLGVPPFPFRKNDPKDPRGPFGPGGFGPGGGFGGGFGPGGSYGGGGFGGGGLI